MLTMITSNLATGSAARNWKIRVAQIPCNEGYAGVCVCVKNFFYFLPFLISLTRLFMFSAPPGCLQYFTGGIGVLKSFNFFFDARGSSTARQLSGQDYTICLRQESVNKMNFFLLMKDFRFLLIK